MTYDLETALTLVREADPLLLAFAVIVFEIPRYTVSLFTLALMRLRKPPPEEKAPEGTQVSVIIAAFNAGPGLLPALRSLRNQSLAPAEIIFVNDGSTDGTRALAAKAQQRGLVDTVIHHGTRCGKSAAINHGARFARGDLLLTGDADTVFDREAVARLAAAFTCPEVAAASGNIRIRNREASLSTAFQEIEYMISISTGKSFLDLIGAVSCCSGACAMYKRSTFAKLGGLNVGPGEDLEYTLRLRRLGYGVRLAAGAWAETAGPETFPALFRQRMRWDRDALRTRLIEYREIWPFRREWLADTLQRLDFIVFDLVPAILFPFYLAYCFALMRPAALVLLTAVYVFIFAVSLFNIAVSNLLFNRSPSFFSLLAAPAFPLYSGIVMKLVRFAAFTSEILFTASRKDDYVPSRVRRALFQTPPNSRRWSHE